jgi:predicted transposase/invertase (TIGR01784 family)
LTDIEKWMIFFRYATDKSKRDMLNKILEKEEGIGMAVQILERMSLSEEERAGYEAVLLAELDERSERRARDLEIARNFKNKNVPLTTIAESTGLSLEEVESL